MVELLVVIGIIALLISILLPALSKARKQAQEVQCESNLRQWGAGFISYSDSNKGALPSDAPDGLNSSAAHLIGPQSLSDSTPCPFESNAYWFNAIPPYVNQKAYIDQIYDDMAGFKPLSHAMDNSIFVCPSASEPGSTITAPPEISDDGHYFLVSAKVKDANYAKPGPSGKGLSVGNSPQRLKIYMCYVFNSKLFGQANDGIDREAWKFTQLRPSSSVVLMTEKIMQATEYKYPAQPGGTFGKNVGQPKACWTRFTTRHRNVGFLLFADGHVGWFAWGQLQNGIVDPTNTHHVDGNLPGLGVIWNPLSGVGDTGG